MIEILPLSTSDLRVLNNISVDSSNLSRFYLLISILLGMSCYLISWFNLFNNILGQSETVALVVGFFALIFFVGFYSSWAKSVKFIKKINSFNKYCGNARITKKWEGDDEYEIYFEANSIVNLPVFLIQKWKYKNIFDEVTIGDIVTFEYVQELNLFLKLDWNNLDLRQFTP